MNPPKVTDENAINILMATPKVCSTVEAARVPLEANHASVAVLAGAGRLVRTVPTRPNGLALCAFLRLEWHC